MIKEALLCALSTIVDFSGVHYKATVPKLGTVRDQTIIYWNNVGNYIGAGIAVEAPKVEAAKQKQLELGLGCVE